MPRMSLTLPRCCLLLMLACSWLAADLAAVPTAVGAETARVVGPVNTSRLEGRWRRADGGYLLDLRGVDSDGRLHAAYFNPRPIKVGRAELRRSDGTLLVYVELRDVNYPGSAYTLRHDPKRDRLVGTYFQAVEKQTYEVEFVRVQ